METAPPPRFRYSDPELEETARAIGYICMFWAQIDRTCGGLIERCLGIDHQQRDVLMSLGDTRSNLKTLEGLLFLRSFSDEWFNGVRTTIRRLDKSYSQRSRYVHDAWQSHDGLVYTMRPDRKIERPQSRRPLRINTHATTVISVDELWDHAYTVQQDNFRLMHVGLELHLGAPKSMPGTEPFTDTPPL